MQSLCNRGRQSQPLGFGVDFRRCRRSSAFAGGFAMKPAIHVRSSSSASSTGGASEPSSPMSGSPASTFGKRVQFENGSQENLVGSLVDASSSPSSADSVVILCHGYASSKNSPLMVQLARELANNNLSSLRFDFSGNGDSEGVFQFANYTKEARDLRAAVLYVRGLQRNVAAVVGHSKGGDVVLLYAATHDDVPLVVNVAGRFNLQRGLTERFGAEALARVDQLGQLPQATRTDSGAVIKFVLTKQDLEERRSINMQATGRKITLSEVLTVHGTADQVIPVEDAHAFAACIRQHELFLVEGADHCFRAPQHADALVKKVAAYVTAGLQ